MTQTNTTEQPLAMFSHTMTFPGVPLTTLTSALGMLLSAYGVKHTFPVNTDFSSDALTSADENTNARFASDFMMFKSMLADMSRQYKTVQCSGESNGVSVYMRFSCY